MTNGLNGEESRQDLIDELRDQLAQAESDLAVNQGFVNECPMALIAIDLETQKIQLWNKYATVIFGFTESEALGQELSLIIPGDVIGMAKHMANVRNYADNDATPKGMGGDRGFQAKTKSGKKIDIEIKIFPLNAREIMYVGAAAEDVSELTKIIKDRESALAELERVKQELEQSLDKVESEKIDLIEVNSKANQERLAQKIYAGSILGVMSLLVLFGVIPMMLNWAQAIPDDMVQTSAIAVQGLLQVLAGMVGVGVGSSITSNRGPEETTTTNSSSTRRRVTHPSAMTEEEPYNPSNPDFPTTYDHK